MRALYVIENTTLPDFNQLNDNGLNTIFWCDSLLQINPDQTISNLQNLLTVIDGLDIDLYLDIYPWQTDVQHQQPDPRDPDYLSFIQDKIEMVYDNISPDQLKGVLFDDLYIRADNPYWDELIGHCDDPNDCPYLEDIVNTYASGVSEGLKSIDSRLELSGNITVRNIPGTDMASLADIFDFMIIMADPNCVMDNELIDEGIGLCGDTPAIVEVVSVESGGWLNPELYVDNSILESYFTSILRKGANGYCLYAAPCINYDLKFVGKKTGMVAPNFLINHIG